MEIIKYTIKRPAVIPPIKKSSDIQPLLLFIKKRVYMLHTNNMKRMSAGRVKIRAFRVKKVLK
jgi:hypothetical protein